MRTIRGKFIFIASKWSIVREIILLLSRLSTDERERLLYAVGSMAVAVYVPLKLFCDDARILMRAASVAIKPRDSPIFQAI